MANEPVNQNPDKMPSSQVRRAHREWIAGRSFTLLSHYWRDDDSEALTAAMGKDWADVLEGLPQDAIQKACIQYQRDEPRRKPTPGAIYALARDAIPRPKLVRQPLPPEPVKERCDPKTAQEICEAAGFTPKRFGGEA